MFFLSKKKNKEKEKNIAANGRKYELVGIAFVTIAIISACGLSGLNVGFIGLYFAKFLRYMFGIGAWFTTLLIALVGAQYIMKHRGLTLSTRFFGLLLLYFSCLAVYHHFVIPSGEEILPASLPAGGGLIGGGVLFFVRKFFGVDGGIIVLGAGIIGSVLLSTTWSLASGMLKTKQGAENGLIVAKDTIETTYGKMVEVEGKVKDKVKGSFYNQEQDGHFSEDMAAETETKTSLPEEAVEQHRAADEPFTKPAIETEALPAMEKPVEQLPLVPAFTIEYSEDKKLPASEADRGVPVSTTEPKKTAAVQPTADDSKAAAAETEIDKKPPVAYELPKVQNILSKHVKKKNTRLEREIADNARTLAKTLDDFHVKATIINACHGPAVTRYELEPAPGVKVSKITNLADDLALSLAAFSVRIEPIPGKAAIGVEVPNKELEGVQLRDVLENDTFTTAKSKLTVGLGMDIGGQAIFADLAKMPHLLVAGATGSGKSVCINTLITSILFKATPDEVKFILIDPKMVELSNYNGIPHLMVPVVTDAKKAASVLNWAVQEMEKRYAKFAAHGVRDMERYNSAVQDEKMPAVVIIIDELADLMMVAPHDVEDAICRLAQKARAAGIHLVLATQRPSVDVITGIIKANIPSRISFSVSSQIDSRTILDMGGAEKLLGKGDMLFYPVGAAKPRRVQGAFVSDQEVEELLDFIRKQGQTAEPNEEIINFTEQEADAANKTNKPTVQRDELLEQAVNLVLSTGQASSSSIQRRFRIGYTRAARLIDTMEELHIVGPNTGSKPREILMTSEQAMQAIQTTDN